MKNWIWGVATAFCALGAAGCSFSASASGKAETGGESKLEGDASLTTDPPAESDTARKSAIRYEKGKLDYEGVINFEYNRAEIRSDPETKQTLGQLQEFLNKNPGVKISVEGHTDSRGSDAYNRKLSDRRAASVRKWLLDSGISEDRVTSVGKGEDEPQVPEPDECNDKDPEDTSTCEGPWARNRRVVFQVTEGGDSIPEEVPEPTPDPKPEEPAPAKTAEERCRWLFGPRLGVLGPNSWVNINGAVQPCLDWLELSLGVGLGLGSFDAESQAGDADGSYWSLTVPIRARVYPFRVHSPILDLGIGFTHYNISSEADDGAGNNFKYENTTTPFIAHAGLGYAYRPNGPEPGLRVAIMLGLLFHLSDLAGPDITADPGFPAASATELRNNLNDEADQLAEFEPYAELSVGWMF